MQNHFISIILIAVVAIFPLHLHAEENSSSDVQTFELSEELDTFDSCINYLVPLLSSLSPAEISRFCWVARDYLTPAEEALIPEPIHDATIYATLFDLNRDGIDDIIYSVLAYGFCGNKTCHLKVIFRLNDDRGKQSYRISYISGHSLLLSSFEWSDTGNMGEVIIKAGSIDHEWSVDVSEVFSKSHEFFGQHYGQEYR